MNRRASKFIDTAEGVRIGKDIMREYPRLFRRASPEEQLQRAVAEYLDFALARRNVVWFAVPNGGGRTKAEGGALKAQGVKAGVPDLCFIRPEGPFFIELKSDTGRLSEAQKAMIERLRQAGAETFVCRSIDDVAQVIRTQTAPAAGRGE